MFLNYRIKNVDKAVTIKSILKEKLSISNRLLTSLKNDNLIFLNGIPTKINCPTIPDDIITINIQSTSDFNNIKPENIPLDILYEDDYLIIINKKPNIVVHPTYLYKEGTIANGLLYYYMKNNIKTLIRPVSRLDKDTSGIISFAKNPYIQECLVKQMHEKKFLKTYTGLAEGIIKNDQGTINAAISRKPGSIIERCVSQNGSMSITHFKVLKRYTNSTLLSFNLETGKTHQIRVHCQYINHPLIGDKLYNNNKSTLISRQVLHSTSIEFIHPISNKALKLSAPIPYDIENLLNKLKPL